MPAPKAGLEEITAGVSAVTEIRGEEGQLLYRGYDVRDLAEKSTFEEVAYLLWCGDLPTREQLEHLQAKLRSMRRPPRPVLDLLRSLPQETLPMDALRTAVSLYGSLDPEPAAGAPDANLNRSIGLTAAMPTMVAGFQRASRGLEPLEPLDHLGHAANFLYLLSGKEPSPTAARAVDVALILQADHELNASTFAARVTASTLSDLYSAVVAAIGALKGPLHGGANQQVMELVERIGTPERVEPTVKEMLARKQKIPGFGHRVYRRLDPRVAPLRAMSGALADETGNRAWYELASALEQAVQRVKPLVPNLDLYSGSVYRALDIPTELYTSIFALGRISGWTAHILEQYADNRLIRPRAAYVGSGPRAYVVLEKRG